jgi:hypothetical protein
MFKKLSVAFTAVAAVFSVSSAHAYDFTQADELFSQREGNLAKIAEARAGYVAALGQTSGVEKVYAVDQIVRLDYYEIQISEQKQRQMELADSCRKTLKDQISPAQVGETPNFYYWNAVCLASWAKANGPLQSLIHVNELLKYIDDGAKIDPTFEGGGFARVGSVVWSRLPNFPTPFSPKRDFDKALSLVTVALDSPAYSGELDAATATGKFFYTAYEYKAEILENRGDREGAIATLREALAKIDQGQVSMGREPETKQQAVVLRQMLARLGG